MIKAIYDLDMTPMRTLPIIINVSQYDDLGRTLVFNLFSSSGKWTAPTSAAVTFEGGKPDGKFFSYNCAYSNGTVTVTIQQQMTAVAGKVRCKIKVKSGDKVVESAPIIMVVDAAAVPDGSDMSKTDINDAIANATQKIVDQVKDNIPPDYSQLSTDVSSLKEDLEYAENRITGKMKVVEPVNVWGKNEINDGYVTLNGVVNSASTLYYMPLNVKPGDVLRNLNWTESQNKYNTYSMRFIAAYDLDGNAVPDKGAENANNWAVPDGIHKVIVTISKNIINPCLMVNSIEDPNSPTSYFSPYYVADEGFVDEKKIVDIVKQEVTDISGKMKVPPCVLENGMLWNTDSDKMVVTFTLGGTSDAIFVVANASGTGRVYYVNYSTGKLGTVRSSDMTSIPSAWGYFDDIAIPAVVGRMYTLTINKINGTIFKMTLTDLVTLEKQTFIDQHDQGSGNGARFVMTSGSPTINNFVTMSTQSSNPLIMFIGDSFIEGNQINVPNKDKRYCALVRDNISGDTFIYGLAGRNSTAIADAYYNQIKPICKPKYAFLEIGTNDRDYDTWLSNMQTLIADLVLDDIIPVLCTLTPIVGNPSGYNDSVMPNVNAWIKSSGYKYVDFNAALTSDGATQISDYFLDDGCHPNIDGNAVMYDKIREDVPELFG